MLFCNTLKYNPCFWDWKSCNSITLRQRAVCLFCLPPWGRAIWMLIRGAENWNEGIELVLFQHCQTGPVAEIHCPPPGKINAIPPVSNGKGGCIHSNVASEVIQGKTEHKFRKGSWEEQTAGHVFAGQVYIFSCAKISLYSHLHIQPPLPWPSARWGCHVRAHTHMHTRPSVWQLKQIKYSVGPNTDWAY